MNELMSGESDPKPEQIEKKENLGNRFKRYYEGIGYDYQEPIPLVPGDLDKSVSFTSATINGWKSIIKEDGLPETGIFTIQPCLRNQNVKSIFNIEQKPNFCGYFNMAGILAKSDRKDAVLNEALGFLKKGAEISLDDILIHLPSKHADLLAYREYLNDQGIKTAVDEIDWYDWQYGLGDKFVGRGLTFALKNTYSGSYEEIGNMVIISDDGIDKAAEFGFGLETFLSRKENASHPIQFSEIADLMPHGLLEQAAGIRLADAMVALSAIISEGTDISNENPQNRHLIGRYLRGICYLGSVCGMSSSEITNVMNKFSLERFKFDLSKTTIPSFVGEHFKKFETRRNQFERSVMEILKNPIRNTQDQESTAKSLKFTAINNGIKNSDQAIGIILSSLQYKNIKPEDLNLLRVAFKGLDDFIKNNISEKNAIFKN